MSCCTRPTFDLRTTHILSKGCTKLGRWGEDVVFFRETLETVLLFPGNTRLRRVLLRRPAVQPMQPQCSCIELATHHDNAGYRARLVRHGCSWSKFCSYLSFSHSQRRPFHRTFSIGAPPGTVTVFCISCPFLPGQGHAQALARSLTALRQPSQHLLGAHCQAWQGRLNSVKPRAD